MSVIMFTTTLESGCLKLPTKCFADGDEIVIAPQPENKAFIYDAQAWRGMQRVFELSFTQMSAQHLLLNYPSQIVMNQTIKVSDTLFTDIQTSARFWWIEHKSHVEIRPIKKASTFNRRQFNKDLLKYSGMIEHLQDLLDAANERKKIHQALDFDMPIDNFKRGISMITIGACNDFQIPKYLRQQLVTDVIQQVLKARQNYPKDSKLSLWIYAIARKACLPYSPRV